MTTKKRTALDTKAFSRAIEALAKAVAESGPPTDMPPQWWWWLSFAASNPDRFLGVAIVRASSPVGAVGRAALLGINPGGQVSGYKLPEGIEPPAAATDRLLSKEEAEALNANWATSLEEREQRKALGLEP